jgi:broad specificity phosphatase PhoE
MVLTLVRHGESSGNAGLGFEGPEPHLTERGRRQVQFAAARVREERNQGETYDALYTSCMSRALETACALAGAAGLQPCIWVPFAEWRELPEFRGCPRSVLESRYPGVALPEECTEEGWWHHGREDRDQLYTRARQAADYLRSHHEQAGHRVLLVTHGGFGSALLDIFLGLPPCDYARFEQRNCAFSRLILSSGFTRLVFANCRLHLPAAEIT